MGTSRRGIQTLVALATLMALVGSGCSGSSDPGSGGSERPCSPEDELVVATTGSNGQASTDVVQPQAAIDRPSGLWTSSRPEISPDGTRIATIRALGDYESAGPGGTELWTVGVTGDDPRQLSVGGNDDYPSWSPDGRTIVVSRWRQDQSGSQLVVVDADTGDSEAITDEPGVLDTLPRWSPDGSSLAFVRSGYDTDEPAELMVMSADGSGLTSLVEADRDTNWLTWAPDGRSLLVSGLRGPLSTVDLDGTVEVIHPRVAMPAFSPDGRRLYYAVNGSQGWRLAQGHLVEGELVRDRWLDVGIGFLYPYFGLSVGPCPPGQGDPGEDRPIPPDIEGRGPCSPFTDVVAVERPGDDDAPASVVVQDGYGNAPFPVSPSDWSASQPAVHEGGVYLVRADTDPPGSIWAAGVAGWQEQGPRGSSHQAPDATGLRVVVFATAGNDGASRTHLAMATNQGAEPVALTDPGEASDSTPALSPTASTIAFLRSEGADPEPPTSLWTINADGSDPREIADLGPTPRGARLTWTPDATALYVHSPDGLEARNLSDGTVQFTNDRIFAAAYSDDGERLYVVTDEPESGQRAIARGRLDREGRLQIDEYLQAPSGDELGTAISVGGC